MNIWDRRSFRTFFAIQETARAEGMLICPPDQSTYYYRFARKMGYKPFFPYYENGYCIIRF
jgi:hypothetical protein